MTRARRLIWFGYIGCVALIAGGVIILAVGKSVSLGVICLVLGVVNIWTTRASLRRTDAMLAALRRSPD